MAKKKKVAKKSKPSMKSVKKPASKPAKKAAKASKPAKSTRSSMEPMTVKTGSGATPLEVGKDLVAMFNAGKVGEIEAKHWSPKITSIEGVGVSMGWSGKAAVEAKNQGWMMDHVIHGASAEGPYVGATGFSVKFRMDVETKSTGERTTMEEVGVYTVQDGKIVREEFMYACMG